MGNPTLIALVGTSLIDLLLKNSLVTYLATDYSSIFTCNKQGVAERPPPPKKIKCISENIVPGVNVELVVVVDAAACNQGLRLRARGLCPLKRSHKYESLI